MVQENLQVIYIKMYYGALKLRYVSFCTEFIHTHSIFSTHYAVSVYPFIMEQIQNM